MQSVDIQRCQMAFYNTFRTASAIMHTRLRAWHVDDRAKVNVAVADDEAPVVQVELGEAEEIVVQEDRRVLDDGLAALHRAQAGALGARHERVVCIKHCDAAVAHETVCRDALAGHVRWGLRRVLGPQQRNHEIDLERADVRDGARGLFGKVSRAGQCGRECGKADEEEGGDGAHVC